MVEDELAADNTLNSANGAGESKPGIVEDGLQSPKHEDTRPPSKGRTILNTIYYVPPWCRWNPDNPPKFTIYHNVLFAFAGAFTVANLYYNHPILNILAEDFNVSQVVVSRVPTLYQAGYATGVLLILPLGDMVPRRHMTLSCIFFTATMWIGLCITNQFNAFLGISFITAVTTVTPQIMLPLVAELATPETRAFSLSIVGSGNALGICLARIFSGVVTNYTSWRNIYWLSLGLQYLIFSLLFLFMPDYPSKNNWTPRQIMVEYPKALWSVITMVFKYPVLVQAGMISFCTSVPFTTYWTTLTFLLAGPPYHYDPVKVGLFGLIGLAVIALNPFYGKYLIRPLREPSFSIVLALGVNLIGVIIGTYAGEHTVAGPIIQGFTLDACLQIVQISNRIAIHPVEPNGRNRVNTVFMLLTFLGQLTGTSAGNVIYDKYGGWVASGSLSVAVLVFAFVIILARGPYEKGWLGWGGGWGLRPKGWKPEDKDGYEHEGGEDTASMEVGEAELGGLVLSPSRSSGRRQVADEEKAAPTDVAEMPKIRRINSGGTVYG